MNHTATQSLIRWMIRKDMPEVLNIEELTNSNPDNEEQFLSYLRQKNIIGMVSEYQEQVVGFMIYELQKFNLDIIKFAVHPNYQRQSIGAGMINKLKSKLHNCRRTFIQTEVDDFNLKGQLFLQSRRFIATKVIRNRYQGKNDIYKMEFHLPTTNRIQSYLKAT